MKKLSSSPIFEWISWSLYQYQKWQRWVLARELHIAQANNPLVWLKLVWEAIKTASLPILLTLILFIIALHYRDLPHVAAIVGGIIAVLALWFGLTRNRDTSVLDSIKEVCRRAKVNDGIPGSRGYAHVEEMIGNFRQQPRFYNRAVLAVNFALFAVGMVLSFM